MVGATELNDAIARYAGYVGVVVIRIVHKYDMLVLNCTLLIADKRLARTLGSRCTKT